MADDIRTETRARMREAAERWERIVALKQREGGSEYQDAVYCLHAIKCALNVLRSRAHRRYVTDDWLREMTPRRPVSEIARMIETMIPEGYPEPPAGRVLTRHERSRILSGELTVPASVVAEAERLDALDATSRDDVPDFG